MLAWGQRAAARLTALEGDDDRIGLLAARRDELVARARPDRRPAVRGAGGGRRAVRRPRCPAELAALAMANAAVEVAVTQPEGTTGGLAVGGRTLAYGPHGVDDVELLLRPHAGAPARALQKGASGGELSRVMLAVEVVLVGTDPVPTLVFDEVDAGRGRQGGGRGRAAGWPRWPAAPRWSS